MRPLILLCLLLAAVPARAEEASEEQGSEEQVRRIDEKLAELHEEKGQEKEALAIWRDLARRYPREQRYLAKVATLALELQQLPLARQAASSLVRLAGRAPEPHALLGRIHLELSQPSLAVPHLRFALAARPQEVALRRALAEALSGSGRCVEAMVHLDWLVSRHPTDVELGLDRSDCLGTLNRRSEQRAELERLQRIAPHQRRVTAELVALDLEGGDYPRARRDLSGFRAASAADRKWQEDQLVRYEALSRRAQQERAAELRWRHLQLDLELRQEDF